MGLKITAKANTKTVDFLDLTFDLNKGTYSPYNKPNNTPQYVHKLSNHPPSVLKNIPEAVNKRLSCNSSTPEIFNKAAPPFQEALTRSGYNYTLKYNPPRKTPRPKNKRNKRNVIWFNPPFNLSVKTNIGQEFLKLVDKCFPPSHPLAKIFNRKSVKISYSGTPNIQRIIAGKNAKILRNEEHPPRTCNCRKDTPCPMDGKCLEKNIIYQATVIQSNGEKNSYIGNTSTEFKQRLAGHKQTFKNSEIGQTSLSNHIQELKSQNIDFDLNWKILDRGTPFSPVSKVCNLCTKEKYHILFQSEMSLLNSKSEMYSHCRHIQSRLLIPKVRKKKKSPG